MTQEGAPPEKVDILLVDDRPESLIALEALLEPMGHNLVKAASGREALRHILERDFAVILLDVQMPEIDGFETAALIRERDRSRHTPIIFLTAAYKNEAHMFKGYAAGAVDYLVKPIVPEILKSKVGVFIELAKKTAALQALNARLRLQASELAAANKELESFSYSVSHDLRGPLRGIDGFSQILRQKYSAKLDAQGRDYLERMQASVQRMSKLIEDLLKLARLGRRPVERESVDLTSLARAILKSLERGEPARRVETRVAEGIAAKGDPGLLLALLENLLGNAWKFTAKREEALIEFGSARHNGSDIYFIRDNGCGFDPAAGAKLFGPFQRLHQAEEFPGTGIGLATAQRIIERHGGRIWAEGAVGKGATFYFTL